jgi:hypothetical protein
MTYDFTNETPALVILYTSLILLAYKIGFDYSLSAKV